jgi:hypothetical protein
MFCMCKLTYKGFSIHTFFFSLANSAIDLIFHTLFCVFKNILCLIVEIRHNLLTIPTCFSLFLFLFGLKENHTLYFDIINDHAT